jgi:GrpB-like predicted nucleotidyltransferase (UPF0157 family)
MNRQELSRLFPIILTAYNPDWPKFYRREKSALIQAAGLENIVRIRHFGSTSIPGLSAKPTIDILLEIKKNADTKGLITNIRKLGYNFSPQPDNPPPHIMFMKGYTPNGFSGQAFHVHVRYRGDWNEIYFRDYLRNHPETAAEYAVLKYKLKSEYEFDRDGYTNAKSVFINRITEIAEKNQKQKLVLCHEALN